MVEFIRDKKLLLEAAAYQEEALLIPKDDPDRQMYLIIAGGLVRAAYKAPKPQAKGEK